MQRGKIEEHIKAMSVEDIIREIIFESGQTEWEIDKGWLALEVLKRIGVTLPFRSKQ